MLRISAILDSLVLDHTTNGDGDLNEVCDRHVPAEIVEEGAAMM